MDHPLRFDAADPLLHALRALCLRLPGAQEKVTHGRPGFYTKKLFAIFGGVVKGSHADRALTRSLLFLPDVDHRDVLLGDERFVVPAYEGAAGWLCLPLDRWEPDWDEVADLVEESYRLTAPARLVAHLDGGRQPH